MVAPGYEFGHRCCNSVESKSSRRISKPFTRLFAIELFSINQHVIDLQPARPAYWNPPIEEIDAQFEATTRRLEACKRLMAVPGIGLQTATAAPTVEPAGYGCIASVTGSDVRRAPNTPVRPLRSKVPAAPSWFVP